MLLALQLEAGVPSAAALGKMTGPGGPIAASELLGRPRIAPQLTADGGGRTADLRSDPATAQTAGEQMIDLDPLVERQV